MIRIAPNLNSIVDRDGAVILDTAGNTMTTLDPIGAYVWDRLQRGIEAAEIVSDLVRDTSVDRATADLDVHAFIEELKNEHLLTVA